MPDITMCEGTGCKWANRCYRATAKPNEYRQSYFLGTPNKGDDCDHFVPNEAPNVAFHVMGAKPNPMVVGSKQDQEDGHANR